MENTENLSAQQSLEIISSMIREAQGNMRRNSFYYLLWGWVVAIADIGVYTLIHLDVQNPFLVWFIVAPAWVITMVRGFRHKDVEKRSTHIGRVNGLMWMAFGLVAIVIIIFGNQINYQINSIILVTTMIPTFASGIALRFRPLVIGGWVFLAGGIISFLVPIDIQFLVGAVTVIIGFLIPGYLIRRENV